MKPRTALVAVALACTLLTAGCGEGTVDGAGRDGAEPSAQASGAPQGTGPVEVEGLSRRTAADAAVLLTGVKVTGHDTFDRVRFTFDGGVTKVFASYQEALREPGRGRKIPLAGEHRLVLVLVGTARQKPAVDVRATTAVREVRAAGVFEGEMTVGIGTETAGDGPGGFRVRVDGNTVTVDVAHKAATASP